MTSRGGWYERWFGEQYLQLYPHRDANEAEAAVRLVLETCPVPVGGRILDLACGGGRHLNELIRGGALAFGLDLSFPLLTHARAIGARVVRGDMRRLPFAGGSFSLVTNFFTSFGYFSSAAEDREVLVEVRRILAPGGMFVFDFLNADRVRANLPSRDERVVDGQRVVQTRALTEEGRVVEKKIEILGPTDPLPHVFYERVRLYSAGELHVILEGCGLQVVERFGSYAGEPLDRDSARVILIGRAV